MKRLLLVLAAVALLAGAAGVGWYALVRPAPPEWTPDVQAAADANNRFALDLYAKLREQEKGKNVFYSPYSVHAALAMTASGAGGNTREQMMKVLHLPDDTRLLAAGDMGRFYDHPRRSYELAVANAIWGRSGYPWRQEFRDTQKKRFGSELREADFRGNPDGERMRINNWVEQQTHNRIKDLLQRGMIDDKTTMVLVNAIYFKGQWATRFQPDRTRDATFHCADDSRVQVPMMYGEVKCGYAAFDDVTMVELPYKGGDLGMVVILPKLPDGLPAVEKRLTPEQLARWFGELRDRSQFQVYLPKFRVEARYELPPHLMALGMTDAFGPADFTRMAEGDRDPIAAVIHKAFVDVNEEGTEAAAATAVTRFASKAVEAFHADHPFLFLIRDTKRGTILFMGAVEKP
jgi:serpin B